MKNYTLAITPAGFALVGDDRKVVGLVRGMSDARLFSVAPILRDATEAALPLLFRDYMDAEQAVVAASQSGRLEDVQKAQAIAQRRRDLYAEAVAALVVTATI